MFDSHEEFNEWFSKDIESHAERKSVLDEHQLSRLHLILKPFMLRRIKKDVEHEMAEKVCGVWCVRMWCVYGVGGFVQVLHFLDTSLYMYTTIVLSFYCLQLYKSYQC